VGYSSFRLICIAVIHKRDYLCIGIPRHGGYYSAPTMLQTTPFNLQLRLVERTRLGRVGKTMPSVIGNQSAIQYENINYV
jgi:hypothetical protein